MTWRKYISLVNVMLKNKEKKKKREKLERERENEDCKEGMFHDAEKIYMTRKCQA